jgi:ABC-type sugar transport system substrate-binding protein
MSGERERLSHDRASASRRDRPRRSVGDVVGAHPASPDHPATRAWERIADGDPAAQDGSAFPPARGRDAATPDLLDGDADQGVATCIHRWGPWRNNCWAMNCAASRLALLAGVLAASLLSCDSGDDGSDKDVQGARLVAVIKALDNPFFVTMHDGLVATARRDDARLRVSAAPSGLQDTAGQASELESLADGDPGCYVVNPINPTNLVGALARVPEDTPIVNVDSVIGEDAAKALGVKITTYIGIDNRAGGRLGADAMAALVSPGASVAVITGIPGDVGSGLRADGFEDGARARFQVVTTTAADFDRNKARLAAADLLAENPRIEGFFAVNDLMALGAADAVRAAGRQGDVKVVGFDGISEALVAIARGSLSATVAQYPYTMGQLSIEACLASLRGDPVPANVNAPVQVVTSENVARARSNFPKPVEPFDDPFNQ